MLQFYIKNTSTLGYMAVGCVWGNKTSPTWGAPERLWDTGTFERQHLRVLELLGTGQHLLRRLHSLESQRPGRGPEKGRKRGVAAQSLLETSE